MKHTTRKKNKPISKNIELLGKFNRYLVENPELANRIPEGAEIVLLPIDDPSLLKANLKILEKLLLRRTTPTVLVKVTEKTARERKAKTAEKEVSALGVLSVVSI
ncbi:MAG: DUF5647 family protein [bacterium]